MAAFLAGIMVLMPHCDFILDTWKGGAVMMHPDMEGYADRWRDVHELANQVIKVVVFSDLLCTLLQQQFFQVWFYIWVTSITNEVHSSYN